MMNAFASTGSAAAGHSNTVLLILGMRGNGCRDVVTSAIEGVDGVHEVQVSLYRGLAVICHAKQCGPEKLIAAVVNAGFGVTPTKLRVSSEMMQIDVHGADLLDVADGAASEHRPDDAV